MSKTELSLLKQLCEAYYFILGIRFDAIERKDGHYIDQTQGIDSAVKRLKEKYPAAKRYFTAAKKKAEASGKQQTKESKAKRTSTKEGQKAKEKI